MGYKAKDIVMSFYIIKKMARNLYLIKDTWLWQEVYLKTRDSEQYRQ